MPADAVVVGADRLAVHDLVGKPVDLRVARDRELLQRVILGLAEVGDEVHQVARRHRLIAQQDGAVPVEGVDHRLDRGLVGARQVDVQDLGAEAWFQGAGANLDRSGHGRIPDRATRDLKRQPRVGRRWRAVLHGCASSFAQRAEGLRARTRPAPRNGSAERRSPAGNAGGETGRRGAATVLPRLRERYPCPSSARPARRGPTRRPARCTSCGRRPKTVHWGYFDAALAPVLRVKSGDLDPGRGDHPPRRRRAGADDGRGRDRHLPRHPRGRPQSRRPHHDRPDLRRGRAARRHAGGALPAR